MPDQPPKDPQEELNEEGTSQNNDSIEETNSELTNDQAPTKEPIQEVLEENTQEEEPPPKRRRGGGLRENITVKMLTIGLLTLLLLVPATMIQYLIQERQKTRDTAMSEISAKWGRVQTIGGPVLTIPYEKVNKTSGKTESVGFAHFLPDELNITGNVDAKTRYRSIYQAVLYNTKLDIKGVFPQPTADHIKNGKLRWKEAFLSLGIPDMQGINERINLNWNKEKLYFEPGIPNSNIFLSGVSIPVPLEKSKADSLKKAGEEQQYTFDLQLDLNGSEALNFIPLGKETNVQLQSEWSNPSFDGAFLPDEREINPDSFSAAWKVLHLNRNYPQKWVGKIYKVEKSMFGVRLITPVDEYQKNTRSSKYAIMFLALTFMVFFFVEIRNKTRMHPIQYLLVGLGLCLFYLLLLALSEHISFNKAYLVASTGIILLITLYSHTIFSNKILTLVMGVFLTALYIFLFCILQLQDYSLLMGSIGLFIMLALVMYFSRNIDWYTVGTKP